MTHEQHMGPGFDPNEEQIEAKRQRCQRFDETYASRRLLSEADTLARHRQIGTIGPAGRIRPYIDIHQRADMQRTEMELLKICQGDPSLTFADLQARNRAVYEGIRTSIMSFQDKFFYS